MMTRKRRLSLRVATPLPVARPLDDILEDIDAQVVRLSEVRARALALIGRLEERTSDDA